MSYPDFIKAFPALDVPYPESVVSTRAVRSERGLVVFFEFHEDFELPAHSHLAQWGCLVRGEIEMTIGDETRNYHPGDTWNVPAGSVHSARIKAGTLAIDVFEEPDRYPLKG